MANKRVFNKRKEGVFTLLSDSCLQDLNFLFDDVTGRLQEYEQLLIEKDRLLLELQRLEEVHNNSKDNSCKLEERIRRSRDLLKEEYSWELHQQRNLREEIGRGESLSRELESLRMQLKQIENRTRNARNEKQKATHRVQKATDLLSDIRLIEDDLDTLKMNNYDLQMYLDKVQIVTDIKLQRCPSHCHLLSPIGGSSQATGEQISRKQSQQFPSSSSSSSSSSTITSQRRRCPQNIRESDNQCDFFNSSVDLRSQTDRQPVSNSDVYYSNSSNSLIASQSSSKRCRNRRSSSLEWNQKSPKVPVSMVRRQKTDSCLRSHFESDNNGIQTRNARMDQELLYGEMKKIFLKSPQNSGYTQQNVNDQQNKRSKRCLQKFVKSHDEEWTRNEYFDARDAAYCSKQESCGSRPARCKNHQFSQNQKCSQNRKCSKNRQFSQNGEQSTFEVKKRNYQCLCNLDCLLCHASRNNVEQVQMTQTRTNRCDLNKNKLM